MTSQERRDDTTDRDELESLLRETGDIHREMSRLLSSRRWERHEGPFRGFQSPPGRF